MTKKNNNLWIRTVQTKSVGCRLHHRKERKREIFDIRGECPIPYFLKRFVCSLHVLGSRHVPVCARSTLKTLCCGLACFCESQMQMEKREEMTGGRKAAVSDNGQQQNLLTKKKLFLLFLLFRACPQKISKLFCKPRTLRRKTTNRWLCVWVLICYCCWISYLQCELVTLGTELCPCLACCNCYAQHCALGSASDGFH